MYSAKIAIKINPTTIAAPTNANLFLNILLSGSAGIEDDAASFAGFLVKHLTEKSGAGNHKNCQDFPTIALK
jgi:hypothetical protein